MSDLLLHREGAIARFTVVDADQAYATWGCNCGPGAVAGVLGLMLDEVRQHMGDFERKGYTNPTLMFKTLRAGYVQVAADYDPLAGNSEV